MTFDLLFISAWHQAPFNLAWKKKIILGCKFHILGIKTTLGQDIAKNLLVYVLTCNSRTLNWVKLN